MMVNRYGCESCENYLDALKKDGEFICADCGEPVEFVGKVGCVRGLSEGQTPNSRLQELADEWRKQDPYAADELEEAMVDDD